MPIELDDEGNLSQNGKTIINLKEAKSGNYQYTKRTETIITSVRNVVPSLYESAQVQKFQPQVNESQAFEELQETDAINPDFYYKILGIPEEKVVDFEFKPRDVYLT